MLLARKTSSCLAGGDLAYPKGITVAAQLRNYTGFTQDLVEGL